MHNYSEGTVHMAVWRDMVTTRQRQNIPGWSKQLKPVGLFLFGSIREENMFGSLSFEHQKSCGKVFRTRKKNIFLHKTHIFQECFSYIYDPPKCCHEISEYDYKSPKIIIKIQKNPKISFQKWPKNQEIREGGFKCDFLSFMTPPNVAMKFQNMIIKIQKSLSKSKKIKK